MQAFLKEEERKGRLAEVEKRRGEEAKRKELYDLLKVIHTFALLIKIDR